ncbi:GAF domain-containing protein [Halorussus limi]|uniref:GAF domain-containing protein n=1 Tax=Halorussus limi TaxID=2938695 RepID=A0A8U0HR65_9EURY|nr:GAF domain-containing protein [Halorussus limi]UPV73450.1 GAF domain-containing protein [Halorussus limi]
MSGLTIVCVDPDESAREETLAQLRDAGDAPTLVTAESLAAAEERVRDRDVDCVVTEHDLPDGTGLELAARVRDFRPSVGCVLYTAADREQLATDEFGDPVAEYVAKDAPNAAEQLRNVVAFTGSFRTQTAYPLPQNETDRLAALEAYELDPETLQDDVERITDLAARHLDVPMASVNLIKEHSQEFLVCHGANWTPTNREDSICTYAIVEDGPVAVVEDVKEDPRFAENRTLDDLGIRSYAGADLRTSDGLAIGTLCAYGEEPRTFSESDREFLATLADVTMTVLELHHEVTQLQRDPADLPERDAGSGRR